MNHPEAGGRNTPWNAPYFLGEIQMPLWGTGVCGATHPGRMTYKAHGIAHSWQV